MKTTISGDVRDGFDEVAEAFAAAFEGAETMGAALSIFVDGQSVVDLWGGTADARVGRVWDERSLGVIFSCSKGLVALMMAILVEEGRVDYEAPVTRYWPEFGQAGKSGVLVKDVLAHRAGLSAPRRDLTRADVLSWEPVVAALAEQGPLWDPGTAYSYHALTQGWLAGEIIRRVTGISVGEFFRERIAEPLAVDAWFGLPAAAEARVAHLVVGSSLAALDASTPPGTPAFDSYWMRRAMTLGGAFPSTLVDGDGGFNDSQVHAAEIPAAGAIASARALASIWSAVVAPVPGATLISKTTRVHATRVVSEGAPHFAAPGPWPRWGMGFQLDSAARRYLTASSFGHDGAGGQVSFADPTHRVGFAFLTNVMEADDDRATRIIDALRRQLARAS